MLVLLAVLISFRVRRALWLSARSGNGLWWQVGVVELGARVL